MCDIWKQNADAARELTPDEYRWLPRNLKSINVSGGEPFLRDDLPEIVSVMSETCRGARVVISTNGLLPERIETAVARISETSPRGSDPAGAVAVRVSVDGIGEAHDRMRGIPGAYEKAMETIGRLQGLGVPDLGLAATLTRDNIGEITRVKKKADELGIRFIMSAAHSSPIFFGEHEVERPDSRQSVREVLELMREHLRSWRPYDWARAYYLRGVVEYIRGRPRRLPCRAGLDFFFLDPWGDVYPCNIGGTKMGSVRESSFKSMQKRTARVVRESVASCDVQCWMVCTVAPPMSKRPLMPLAWMLGAKFLGLDTRVD
jgi:MoaA/NifB/PqqE/SkfB family radical SAM enzyme